MKEIRPELLEKQRVLEMEFSSLRFTAASGGTAMTTVA